MNSFLEESQCVIALQVIADHLYTNTKTHTNPVNDYLLLEE